ncbi:hypothetical protein GGR57DRAFT_450364 [Xylariaceae sp. FL1272]|nr:hypothetical protein GGR57DRAFT_450364 [Xylariaceae sp. FL1272]
MADASGPIGSLDALRSRIRQDNQMGETDSPLPALQTRTSDLATQVQTLAAQIPRNQKHAGKLNQKASQTAQDLTNIAALILRNQIDNPSLEDELEHATSQLGKYHQYRAEEANRKWPKQVWNLLRRGSLHEIVFQLEQKATLLKSRDDIQKLVFLSRLQEAAAAPPQYYSNANLASLWQHESEQWRPKDSSVDALKRSTKLYLRLNNEFGDEVRVHLTLTTDFQAACNELTSFVSCFSRNIVDDFPNPRTDSREIEMEQNPDLLQPLILWVYHNVFTRVEFRTASDRQPGIATLRNIVKQMRQVMKEGLVEGEERRNIPIISLGDYPSEVRIGETFDIEVEVNGEQYFHTVDSQDDNLIYAASEKTAKGRKFIFQATGPGEAKIDLNFADYNTLNPNSVSVVVNVNAA